MVYTYNFLNSILTEYPKEYKIEKGWMNFWTDIIFNMLGIIKGKMWARQLSILLSSITALFYIIFIPMSVKTGLFFTFSPSLKNALYKAIIFSILRMSITVLFFTYIVYFLIVSTSLMLSWDSFRAVPILVQSAIGRVVRFYSFIVDHGIGEVWMLVDCLRAGDGFRRAGLHLFG